MNSDEQVDPNEIQLQEAHIEPASDTDDFESQQIFRAKEEILKPTGDQVQKGFKYFDLGVKLEIVLFEF